jgi:hypothetical protein
LIVFIDEPASASGAHESELKRPANHGSQQTPKRTAPDRNTAPMTVEQPVEKVQIPRGAAPTADYGFPREMSLGASGESRFPHAACEPIQSNDPGAGNP